MRNLLLFLLVCVPLRLLLALRLVHASSPIARTFLVLFLLSTATAWVVRTFPETGFFNGNAFWAPLRPLHAALYTVAAGALATGETGAAEAVLLVDVAVGILGKAILDN